MGWPLKVTKAPNIIFFFHHTQDFLKPCDKQTDQAQLHKASRNRLVALI